MNISKSYKMTNAKWRFVQWPLLIVATVIVIPFYYILVILLAVVGISTMNQNEHIRKKINSSKSFENIFLSLVLASIMFFLLLAPGAIYFTPNAFNFWKSLINMNFKEAFNVLAEPMVHYNENISLTYKFISTAGLP